MSETASLPAPGQVARIRQRTYLVEQVVKPKRVADSTLVRLSCVDDDNQGQPLEVLWEKELDPTILTGEAWETVAEKGFDDSRLFAAYLNTLKWNCVTSTDPRLFQSPFRAGIRLDAYQLEPLRKALRMPRVNLFIADDVGLGKTIEAGLIARELLLRKKVREIFVSCPPSMLLQWQEELSSRFGLTFEILDKEYMKKVRRERGFSVNPWSTHTRFLVSNRLLIDENYAGPLRDLLGTFRSGSLVILDEAHHAAPSSGQKYAIDSQITRAVRDLAPQVRASSFPLGHAPQVTVRRLKEDIREIQGGFPKRNVVQVTIDGLPPDAPELKLASLLDQYRELREERLKDETKRKQAAAGLLIVGLQQRLLSSVKAFARTLKVHRRTVQRQWEKMQEEARADDSSTGSLDLLSGSVGNDDDRATLDEEQLQTEEDAQFEAASAATMGPIEDLSAKDLFAREQKLLQEMTDIAEQARGKPDARITRLIEWMRENMCPDLGKSGAKWNNTRVLIFTEYDDTKRYLVQQLQAVLAGSGDADLDANQKSTIEQELEASRERQHALREQIERLRTQLESSRKSIGLSDTHFRSAISCSLELMGSDVLKPVATDEPVSRFEFPALDGQIGADWADTMDTLRVPRRRDQKLWDWRRESPLRPIVFEDPGTLDDDVVHMHLEQRVVQRLLGRFTAQGFVHHDLSRACLAQATDSIPRVILLGRLCLYGNGAARLHEELIPVTARWTDPEIRKEPLRPYAKDAEAKTMALLDESLLKVKGFKLTPTVTEQLQRSAPRDISELLAHLDSRGQEYAEDAVKKLATRGEAEGKAMREILETQQKHIAAEVKRVEKLNPSQRLLDFGDDQDELLQLDANKNFWSRRLDQIREELKTEPGRIQELYSVVARRVEPVGLVYLWPVTG